jgi:hypothetical protein
MTYFEGEVICDARGREVVRFTTPSGVRAAIATDISDEALAKFRRSLKRKLARSQARLDRKGGHVGTKG